jgi:GT2 family glycosyltransferase
LNVPHISFVIPLFNHLEQTRKMLSSLMASLPNSLSYELILADDGSTDGTRDWLRDLDDPRIQKILNAKNLGYAKTNNIAALLAKGEYLGLLNNDLVFKPEWLEPMLAALQDPALNAGIVGNLQYRVEDHALDHAGVVLTPRGQFDHLRIEHDDPIQPARVYVATGACQLIRKADFDALGGFDEVFVNGCEDIDLCLKMRAAGKEIYVAPSSRILHHVSLSRSRVSLQNEKNSQYLYSKWRREIKLQLTKCWISLLSHPDEDYSSYIDGELTPTFKSQPHIAAMTIAEAALQREELRWIRELGQVSVKSNAALALKIAGLQADGDTHEFGVADEVIVSIANSKTVCNFYVCGKLLPAWRPDQIEMTLTLNYSQEKVFHLENGRSVNIGLKEPLLSSMGHNDFKFNVYFKDEQGQRAGVAKEAVVITHFVIDDQVVIPNPDFFVGNGC